MRTSCVLPLRTEGWSMPTLAAVAGMTDAVARLHRRFGAGISVHRRCASSGFMATVARWPDGSRGFLPPLIVSVSLHIVLLSRLRSSCSISLEWTDTPLDLSTLRLVSITSPSSSTEELAVTMNRCA